MKADSEKDAKTRAEEAKKLAQAAEKNAADKKEIERISEENFKKLSKETKAFNAKKEDQEIELDA